MWKYFLCLMSMLLTLTAWGCSLAPQPVARPVTGQQTLEAADHWRILAQQIVKEMQLNEAVQQCAVRETGGRDIDDVLDNVIGNGTHQRVFHFKNRKTE